jgi:3-oxoacyl-[acyl-carrier-protein] synthase II
VHRRVVITGMGVLCSIGIGKDKFWDGLASGRSGIGTITFFDPAEYTTRIAGQINEFNPLDYIDKKKVKRTDRFVQLALAAAKLCIEDSKLNIEKANRLRAGVIVGSGIGGIQSIQEECEVLIKDGPGRVSPFLIPKMIINMAAGEIAIAYGFKGPNFGTCTACASSNNAIGEALRNIRCGDSDIILAGGAEACITPLGVASFCAARALSTRNDDPSHASRPFDKERDGFVMGEGSGILMFEELEHARARGAHIYAELCGYGATDDAYHITAPSPDGESASRAIANAIKDAGASTDDVNYINAHGTSTSLNDKCETLAIKKVFGDRAYKIPVSSTKSMTGHLLGAAGAIELIATVMAIINGIIPPTTNYEFPDPECDLDYVPNIARKQDVNFALSNSLGFGGHNATLAVKKYIE